MSQAIAIAPSTLFQGNDGSWSTFEVQIGTPPQGIYVLPSTSQTCIWAVLDPDGCHHQPLPNCSTLRGDLFTPQGPGGSTTFEWYNGTQADSESRLLFYPESFLEGNYTPAQQATSNGFDNVVIGFSQQYPQDHSPLIKHQVISAYAAQNPYLGFLGLSANPNLAINVQSGLLPSPLGMLNQTSIVPSAYYAYTAGRYYRDQLASLVFGGYDADRGDLGAGLIGGLGQHAVRDLLVNVDHIDITSANGKTISVPGLGIPAFIDSTVPEIWLPQESCASFANTMGLIWDDYLSMYLVNKTQHEYLISSDFAISMTLSPKYPTPHASTTTTTIKLPYMAFYQPISYPLAGILDGTVLHYFPLKQAANVTQYYLGRVFLQEAYLAVDYDREEFYLSQAQFPADPQSTNIKTVYPPGHAKGLSAGAMAGIAVGAVAVVLLLCLALWWFWWRPRSRRRRDEDQRKSMEAQNRDIIGYYGNSEKGPTDEVDEVWAKRELPAEAVRGSVASRSELPSPPTLPQYSPGSPHSRGHGSVGSELDAANDYWSARRLSRQASPVELPTRRSMRFSGPYELPTRTQSPELSADAAQQQSPLLLASEDERINPAISEQLAHGAVPDVDEHGSQAIERSHRIANVQEDHWPASSD